jgi:hypothetical protein
LWAVGEGCFGAAYGPTGYSSDLPLTQSRECVVPLRFSARVWQSVQRIAVG